MFGGKAHELNLPKNWRIKAADGSRQREQPFNRYISVTRLVISIG